jgi:energy-coupling factor transport system ATP-binding protein
VAAGLSKPLAGHVSFRNGNKPKPGLDVAMLFQNPADQLFTDSVDEEVAFGSRNYDCFDSARHDEILCEADLLGMRERRPLMLSVGQQQRTALSACLGLRPRLLILDEPTLGQDWGHLQRLMDFLSLLNRQGTAILLISHDYKLVHRYARRVFLMKNGRIHLAGQFDGSQNFTSKEGVMYETLNA